MLGSFVYAALLGQSPKPIVVDAQIAAASIYKSGMVLTIREAALQEGSHEYEFKSIPLAYEGSFWPQPSEGVEVSDLRSTLEMVPTKVKVPATTVGQLVAFNVGKTMTLVVPQPEGKTKRVTGKAISYDNGIVTLRDAEDVVRPVAVVGEVGIVAKGLVFEKEVTQTLPRIRLTFRAGAKAATKLRFLCLERGATWSNHYLLDLRDKSARLSAKATLGLGSMTMNQVKVDLVSGHPGLNLKNEYDFSLGGRSLEGYISHSGRNYLPDTEVDPYELLEQIIQREAMRLRASLPTISQPWMGYGGMGGGGGGAKGREGLVPDGIDNVVYDPSANSFIVQGTDEAIRQLETAQQVEDAYVIPFGRLSLRPGERLTRVLYDREREFERVFRAAAPLGSTYQDMSPTTIVKVLNDSGAAWTAGPMLVVSNMTPQSLLAMPFTAPGAKVELNLGDAKDVRYSTNSTLLERQVISEHEGRGVVKLTLEHTMSAVNRRTEPAVVELTASGPGTLIDAGGGEAHITAGDGQPYLTIRWSLTLQPGETKAVKCRFTLLQAFP